MTKQLKIKINDREYAADAGDTILDVVRKYDIDTIPTLCHDPKLPPYGSCYLCVVEVEGLEKLVPSCSSPVGPNMAIHTDNERIRASRRTALELLLSNHYADCLGPCTQTCPAGVDVQGYIALMSMGRHREAIRLIKEKNPLPLVCGRVCVRECESACRRNLVDDRVGIDYLKRYASDVERENPWIPEAPKRNGKKVAIVGGGPAGLTCAYFLALEGYAPTIFEASEKLGGMLRYGIPEYRLPKALLDQEIKWIIDRGVEVRTGMGWGKDFTVESLKEMGFDATFLAIGAQKAKAIGLAGEERIKGIIGGADFLRSMQTADPPILSGTVVVSGGGNTAIDAARTALRIGAGKVHIVYRRTMKEMPAHQMEIDAACEEGVDMIFLSTPVSIVEKEGRVEALRCIRMELGEPDASGRRSPVPVSGSEYDLPCDFVISAIGQDIDLPALVKENGLATTRQNAIKVDKGSFATSIPGVFAGGDAITGPAVAIDAIAHGRAAALAMDQYMRTSKADGRQANVFISRKEAFGEIPESEFLHVPRIAKEKMAELPVEERIRSQVEVEVGFTESQALNETGRCLECGCASYFDCALRKYATDFGVDFNRFAGDARKYKVDSGHPFITLDPNKCINCGRCVRTCSEVVKISALGFVYRGFKSVVKPSMEKPLLQTTCISCGNCIAACPTGAITERLPFRKPGPWAFEDKESICSFCSVGCTLSYRVFDEGLFTVANVNGTSHNRGYLCAKGRFGYRYMMDEKRLLKPMIKQKGKWREATWDEALKVTAQKLKPIISRSGADSVAAFASPRLSCEEIYLLQKFVRAGLKTNNIGSFSNLVNPSGQDDLDDILGLTVSTATMDDLAGADVIMVMNADPEENLIAELKIKAALKRGTKIVTVSSSEIPLVKFSELWIDSKRGTTTALINGICKAVIEKGREDAAFIRERTTGYDALKASVGQFDAGLVSEITGVKREKLEALFELVSNREANVVVVYNADSQWEKSRNDLGAIGNLMLLGGRMGKPGNGILLLRDFSNSQGLLDMGADPRYLPGHVRAGDRAGIDALGKLWGVHLEDIFKPVDLKGAMEKDRIKGLIVFGEDPLFSASNLKLTSGADFMVVVDCFMTETAMEADVVLPASLPIETEGTFTACDRRVQATARIFASPTGMDNGQIIRALAEKMNIPLGPEGQREIGEEIRKAVPSYGKMGDGAFWGKGLFEERFMTPDGLARFALFGIDLTPHSGEKRCYLSGENYFDLHIRHKLME
jgi:formate dehydrogenase major subunit